MAAGGASVYDDLLLHISPDKFFIESLTATQVVLVIDRITYELSLQTNNGQIPPIANRKPIAGILGIIPLISGPYLVVVTRKARLGSLQGGEVWRIVETEIISYARSEHHLTPTQLEANRKYTGMLQSVLSTPYFYFSYTMDLSHCKQRLDSLRSPDFLNKSLLDRSEQRFVWNWHLLGPLSKDPALHRYCLPVTHGFVSINNVVIAGTKLLWAIISRRSTQRCGTRLFVRGGDEKGHVANFVETEQLLEVNGTVASFLQTRGSIPLIWHQRPDLRYKPPPTLELKQGVTHKDCFNKHVQEQIRLYGQQVIINLVDQKGAEGRLEQQLKAIVTMCKEPNVFYEPFDFHAECKKMRWDRLSILMDRLSHYQEQFSYFLQSREGNVLSRQSGVFRTNCIDCLDRTNVVQSMLARLNLQSVLVRLGVLQDHMKVEQQPIFEALFKNVWADHADMISIQYTGTGALKTDFTRTGKRTKLGLLEDGRRSLIRYYKNNFADGFRQDSLDLFVGNHCVAPTEGVTHESPLAPLKPDQRYLALPIALALSLAMLTLSLFVPAEYSTEILLSLIFWAVMIGFIGNTMFKNGPEYVDQPRLIQLPPRPTVSP